MEEKALKDLHPLYREMTEEGDAPTPADLEDAEEQRAEWYAEMDAIEERERQEREYEARMEGRYE